MFTSLDWLIVAFFGMTGLSLLAIILMFAMKQEMVKKVSFYFLCLQSMLISWFNALSTPGSYFGEILLGWGLGALSVAALLLQLCGKSEKKSKIARILVTVSVVLGMWNLFIY